MIALSYRNENGKFQKIESYTENKDREIEITEEQKKNYDTRANLCGLITAACGLLFADCYQYKKKIKEKQKIR